jgi:HAE1 family hydrophobic/amphiphilic exporter-1
VVVFLAAFGIAAGFFAHHVPASFLPDEDQGYAYVNVQLPNGASLERTTAAAADVEKIIMDTPGVQNSTGLVGFSLLSFVRDTYNATFFVTFKPWDERTTRAQQFQTLKANLNREFGRLPQAVVFGFSPPAIPGVGTAGGFTFLLEDRSGGDVEFLAKNLNAFLETARKRPEIGSISTTFLPSVPQKFVDVDRDKVLKQGVNLSDVYRTVQAFMGGYFINYFNRFGPRVAGVYRSRRSGPRPGGERGAILRPEQQEGECAPFHTRHRQIAPWSGIYPTV